MATMLRARGAEHPEVAAAILEARGRLGLDPAAFADHLGLDLGLILRAEAGDLPAEVLRPALAALGEQFAT